MFILRVYILLVALAAFVSPALGQSKLPREALTDFTELPNFASEATFIISSGAATPTHAAVVLAAESGATDTLTNLIVSGWNAGDIIYGRADTGDAITVSHGTGNIVTDTGADLVISGNELVTFRVTSSGAIASKGGGNVGSADTSIAVPGDHSTLGAAVSAVSDKVFTGIVDITVTGVINETDDIVLDHPDGARLRITGPSMSSYTISSVGTATGAAKNWSVPITLTDASGISVGDFLFFGPSSVSGTGSYQEITGTWEVTNVAGNVVTVNHHHYASSFPTMTLSGSAKKFNAVLKWGVGDRGIVIETDAELQNIALVGPYDPATGTPVDGPDDGLQVGSAPDTTTTGLTQSRRRAGASTFLSNVAIVNWGANGLQAIGSSVTGVAVSANSNAHRGLQTAEGGKSYFFGSVAAANAASDLEVERNSTAVFATSYAYGGAQQAAYAIGDSSFSITGGYFSSPTGNTVDARDGSFIGLAGSPINVGASGTGVYADNSTVELTASSAVTGGAVGYNSVNGGLVNGRAVAAPTSTTPYDAEFDTGGRIIRHTGELARSDSSLLENASGSTAGLALSSIGDYQFQLGGSALWTIKSGSGVFYPNNATGTIGRSADPVDFVFADDITVGAALDVRTLKLLDTAGDDEVRFVLSSIGDLFLGDGSTNFLVIKNTGSQIYPVTTNSMTMGRADNYFANTFTHKLTGGTSVGLEIGDAATDLLGFYGTSPIDQPTTSDGAATFVENTGSGVKDDSTFDGYTLGQVVRALRDVGILD